VTKALLTNETGKKNKNEKKGTTYLNKKKKLKENEKRTDDKWVFINWGSYTPRITISDVTNIFRPKH